jgi:capsule polysaccharide export protein KpsC/LpsZ
VVTVTGTAGWEACVRARPVMVFGEPWYAGCEGVFRARSAGDVAHAFACIAAGRGPRAEATERFAAAIEAIGRRCYLNPSHAPLYPELDEMRNGAALVDLFAHAEGFAPARADRAA